MNLPNPFPQLIPNRVTAVLRHVRQTVWQGYLALKVEATEATAIHQNLALAKRSKLTSVRPGSAWGRLYDQRWCRISLPSHADRKNAYLEWRDQGEATVYIDGLPYYGFDVAHRHVALPDSVREIWVESICCQSAIWHPEATGLSVQGSVFTGAFLVLRDDQAWAAMHDLQCLVDLMMHLRSRQDPAQPRELVRAGLQPSVAQTTPLYRRLLRLLDEAADVFETAGLNALRKQLSRAFDELRTEKPLVRAALTGHAHIDLVWLWPERIGEAKAVHTFASVNRLMSLYPEFRFAYSQTASYEALKRRSPELFSAVRKRIHSGQWQATGALYVESDTLLPCGEALARSFLLGQKDFRHLQGASSRLLWLPDVFGYSACLPQLMKLASVDWFFTTKLTWSAINRFPFSSFIWRGNDGSEVIAHVTQDSGYNNLVDLPRLHAAANGHIQSDIHPEFLHPTGYGDGGGGPTEEMCERARRLAALADTPALAWDQPEAFFKRMEPLRSRLPVYQGECYLEYHRGTFTTHALLKSAFRALERALQTREAVACAVGETPDLEHPWRRLVFAQFHDYIPGSSVADVYAEGVPELARLAQEQFNASRKDLGGNAPSRNGKLHAFNGLPLPWRGWISPGGELTPRWVELPPLASAPIAQTGPLPPPVTIKNRTLENGRVTATVDARGRLTRLRIDHREIALAGPAATPVLYSDKPANFESWDIDRHSLNLRKQIAPPQSIRIEKQGPDRAVVAVHRKIGEASEMIQRYVLVSGEAVLRMEIELDWHEKHTLLKLHFPTHYRGSAARFGAPFGSVLRGQQPGSTTVDAQWEVPGSRWAAVSQDGEREGLCLVTESKYGFLARDGELTVSLVRSPRITGYDDHQSAAPPHLSRLKLSSPFSDQGHHFIRLAVGAYDACGHRETHPSALAETLFSSPLVYTGDSCSAGFAGIEGSSTLLPVWACPVDKRSWILRLHEVSGQQGTFTPRLDAGRVARICELDGSVPRKAKPIGRLPYRPYQIISLLIERA